MEVATKGKAKRKHLNKEACNELGSTSRGADALTQSPRVKQGWSTRDPNRGLYPRKRQKWGSPAAKQSHINDFFSVTSSPNKPARASFSTHANKFIEEASQKVVVDDDDDDDDDDDNDDVSLLAAPLMQECGANEEEEEESDDVSLLAAEVMPVPQMEDKINYLEGVTSEMFRDDEFDHFNIGSQKIEEEVEALPDAHYGLLGNSRVLLKPQGCIDDLPEEVLRQILSLLPASDLYCNGVLVCHRWSNIIQDAKFVPFKKQYYRYVMNEKDTVLDIFSRLQNGRVIAPALSQYSIRNLVVLMSQHKIGERVRPEDVLQCVKKHRLYPHAEAAIRLHIPDIQKCINPEIEGPNPYAAMAVILILNESVGDVQDLVFLLTKSLSHTAITEYLNHMATMLLALNRHNISISNRVHYNIYYVLHLMENGPFSVSSSESGLHQIKLTGEQQRILSHDIQADHVVKIIAFAGTGKTTTLVKYAEQRPDLRFLYVAFNKSVAREAQCRFPRNVACKTVHSLAYSAVGWRYRQKLTFNLKPFTINSVQPEGRGGFAKAKVVFTTLNTFMASTDPTITTRHVPSTRVSKNGIRHYMEEDEKKLFVRDAQKIWNKMQDLEETREAAYHMTHDGYLKLWQLQNPHLSEQYDVLFIDEAQDCTPAIMDVMLSQRCGKILVGDPHQQIYTFKGAVNALHAVGHTHIYYLTQSFRFGAEIAYVGATILNVCKGVQKILVGGKQKGGVSDETADAVAEAVRTGVSPCRGKTAILSRCNVYVFSEAVRLTDANPQCRIHFVGDIKNIGLTRIMDIWQLMRMTQEHNQAHQQHQPLPKFKDPFIRFFAKKNENAFWALKKYITQTEDLELSAKFSIVEKYGRRIPELVARLERCAESNFHKADFIVGTVHKAKGLEFETVMVTDDFAKVPSARHNLDHFNFSFDRIPDDEWNLLYVAVTRAKTSLIITRNIRHILTIAGEYFLKSQMPVSLANRNEPVPCCIPDCPNCVTPGSAFSMCKQRMKCTDGVSEGGPLCERCVWTRIGPTAFLMTDDVLSMAAMPRRIDAHLFNAMLLGIL